MSDIKMSDVFSLPLDATYDNLQDANGYEVACFEITIQDEAAAHAINSHDKLTARIAELEGFREKAFEAHPNIDIDIEALKDNKND